MHTSSPLPNPPPQGEGTRQCRRLLPAITFVAGAARLAGPAGGGAGGAVVGVGRGAAQLARRRAQRTAVLPKILVIPVLKLLAVDDRREHRQDLCLLLHVDGLPGKVAGV